MGFCLLIDRTELHNRFLVNPEGQFVTLRGDQHADVQ